MAEQPVGSTIREFCRRRRISVSTTFYENWDAMPRVIKIAGKRTILAEDEAAWVERQKAAADAESGR